MINKGVQGAIPKSDNWTVDKAPRPEEKPEMVLKKRKTKKRIKFKRSHKRTIHKGEEKSESKNKGKIISFQKSKELKKSKKTNTRVPVAEMKIPDKHKANVTQIKEELGRVEAEKLESFKANQKLGLVSSALMPLVGVPLTMVNYTGNAQAVEAMQRLRTHSEELKTELRKTVKVEELQSSYKSYSEELLAKLQKEISEEFGQKTEPQMKSIHGLMNKFMREEKNKLLTEIKSAEDFEATINVAVKIVSEKTLWDKLDGPLTIDKTDDTERYLRSIFNALDTSIYSSKVKVVRPEGKRPVTFPGEIVGSNDTRTNERKEKDFLEAVLNTVIEGLLLSENDHLGQKYQAVHKIKVEGPLDFLKRKIHKAKKALYGFFQWTTHDLDEGTKSKLKNAAHKAGEALGIEDLRKGNEKMEHAIHNAFEASKDPARSKKLRTQVAHTIADVIEGVSIAAKKIPISYLANAA